MIVDTSALVAILKSEPGFEGLLKCLAVSPHNMMSASTCLEAAIVAQRSGWPAMEARLAELMEINEISIIPFTAAHAQLASEAFRTFGKGSGHPAQLNFGDCFAYALARERGEPLLFRGDDFVHTDIGIAAVAP